jgi:hypothetical protein
MEKIKGVFPILWSPRFWGIIVTVAAIQLVHLGWIPVTLGEFIYSIAGAATAVGVVDRIGSKAGQ